MIFTIGSFILRLCYIKSSQENAYFTRSAKNLAFFLKRWSKCTVWFGASNDAWDPAALTLANCLLSWSQFLPLIQFHSGTYIESRPTKSCQNLTYRKTTLTIPSWLKLDRLAFFSKDKQGFHMNFPQSTYWHVYDVSWVVCRTYNFTANVAPV